MIYLYDDNGKILEQYEDCKLRDVELDILNGSLYGGLHQADDIRHFKFSDGRYVEKTADEKYAENLITEKERDEIAYQEKVKARERIIQDEIRSMAEERAIAAGKIK